ncbi:hypothetical protein MMYC01_207213 [Madurella mycetomatis]|uniref:Uncharacterized protein n=1 Tax=Madurella mycetomatis TaxID=100816 RepID=A0A175W160_9PEZI|nr:hypothetical protein MMYC01_207213 [Madurella mycetomatis]
MLGRDHVGKEVEEGKRAIALQDFVARAGVRVAGVIFVNFRTNSCSGNIEYEGKASLKDSVRPTSSRMPAAFSGYCPFPPIINLYGNPSGVIDVLATFKLCGVDKSDLLNIVEIHQGFTPRGPLHFKPGLYLRNGTSTDAPVLAAAGDEAREPLLMSTFSVKSFIMKPPLDIEANPRDLVAEIM